ncbi:Protein phosphatase 1G [Dermatophagoides farinae]|uniref:protein-serine/threonine phosphatase n=1 Tax=Dermatophagoides farinae TaxID=6954 RepID=A0A922L3T9_DERFA|nr:Protein phosphatase 1G [Dermatophagoides farinae]
MGSYLSKPLTKIDSSICENDHFIYCTAEMQGWRKTQEDAHVAILNYDDKDSVFFAVFDGHGGDEVSKYCALKLPNFVKNSSLYKEDKIVEALEDSFLKFDNTLKESAVVSELKKLANIDEANEIDENETSDLRKEASIPIEEIINKNFKCYENDKDNENVQNGNSDNSDEQESSSTSSSSDISLKKKSLLLRSETLKAFLEDYLNEEEDDEEDDESDEENGEFSDSSSNDDEENDEENDEEDDDNDEDLDDDDKNDDGEDVATGLKNFFNLDYEPGKGSGCTAIVAVIRDNMLHVANVGDSRCVLSREGKALDMSEDHKPEDDKEKERIINAGGEITHDGRVNGGLNLSRAIGDHMYKNNTKLSDREQMITALPDIRTCSIDVEKDDFLFLACDGIWNSMNSQEVVDFIKERLNNNVDLKVICEELFKACLAPSTDGDGSGCDNMTCILVRFKKPSENSTNNGNSSKRSLEDDSTNHSSTSTLNDEHSESNNKRIRNNDDDETINDDLYKPGSSRD